MLGSGRLPCPGIKGPFCCGCSLDAGTQGHTARRWRVWSSNSGLSDCRAVSGSPPSPLRTRPSHFGVLLPVSAPCAPPISVSSSPSTCVSAPPLVAPVIHGVSLFLSFSSRPCLCLLPSLHVALSRLSLCLSLCLPLSLVSLSLSPFLSLSLSVLLSQPLFTSPCLPASPSASTAPPALPFPGCSACLSVCPLPRPSAHYPCIPPAGSPSRSSPGVEWARVTHHAGGQARTRVRLVVSTVQDCRAGGALSPLPAPLLLALGP